MKPEKMTEALEQAATQLGVQVRYETMTGEVSGAGGLCKVKGQWWVIIDRKVPPAERAATLTSALAQLDTDGIFLPPEVREAIAAARAPAPGPAKSRRASSTRRLAEPAAAEAADLFGEQRVVGQRGFQGGAQLFARARRARARRGACRRCDRSRGRPPPEA